MPKSIYLDSNDFSNLSLPKAQVSLESTEILALLHEKKKSGRALFYMSAIHFSEAVHSDLKHKELAVRRAGLMEELCDGNILRLPTELPKLELQKANTGQVPKLSSSELLSERGEWFGCRTDLSFLQDARRSADEQIQKLLMQLPRHERRKLKSDLNVNKKRSHQKWREIIGAAPTTDEFPANLIDPDIVVAWFLKEISDQEYRERMLNIMHSPYAMFEYVVDETKNREKLYELLRNQGQAWSTDLERTAESMREALTAIALFEVDIDLKRLINGCCENPDFLRQTLSTYAGHRFDNTDNQGLLKLLKSCPSLYSQLEISKAYLLDYSYSFISRIRRGECSPRKTKASDFGDIMHAFYAPYVDIFRCDARFGAILKKHEPIRKHVVDRLADLPKLLS